MVDSVAAASDVQTNATNSKAKLTDNFDTFLTLLTAQLQNQDPLQPVDSTEFTNQLVQFSGVEQQIETNSALADLISITAASTAASLSGYLGKTIEVQSATADLTENGINWLYELPDDAESVILSVKSENGSIVYTETIPATAAGDYEFNWDGKLTNGNSVTSGTYSLLVGATDKNSEPLSVAPRLRTNVSGIDLSTGTTSLTTDAGVFDFSDVLRLLSLN